jgi:hypothetical protein
MCGGRPANAKILLVAIFLIVGGLAGPLSSAHADPPAALSVVGNQLEADGSPIQLRGVGRGAYENCIGNAVYDTADPGDTDDDFADGPVNQASIDVMKSWGINAVRLPVNESCWLGLTSPAAGQPTAPDDCVSGTSTCETTAAQYQQEVENYINLLGQNGLYVVLDLQYTAPPGYYADTIDHFPDAANTPTFWTQVATTFKNDPWVMFDLIGEIGASPYAGPCSDGVGNCYDDGSSATNWTDSQIWNVWLNGSSGATVPSDYHTGAGDSGPAVLYQAVGMQSLIDTVRDTGSTNPVIVSDPDYSLGNDEVDCSTAGNDAAGDSPCWPLYTPHDPDGQMVIDSHYYDFDFVTPSGTQMSAAPTSEQEADAVTDAKNYIDTYMLPLGQSYPLMIGEMGETDCSDPTAPFVPSIFSDLSDIAGADGQNASVFGWSWDADDDDGDSISSGYYCPTGIFGQGGPPLITDYDGSPTAMGQVIETWLQQHATSTPPTVPTTPAPTPTSPSPAPTPPGPAPTPTQSNTATSPTASPAPTNTDDDTPPAMIAAPQVTTAPQITASGTLLVCGGATFANATGASVTYSWLLTSTGKLVAGPSRTDTLAASKVRGSAIECRETVTVASSGASVISTSRTLPVPGAVSSASAGPAKLKVICPTTATTGCTVALALQTAAKRPVTLGGARLTLKQGKSIWATVALSADGRRLLARDHALTAKLTVTETIAGVKQVVASITLKLHA